MMSSAGHGSPSRKGSPRSMKSLSSPAPTTVKMSMCAVAVNHTSRRSSTRTSSLSPIVKSSSVTPRLAAVSSPGSSGASMPARTNPAARKPTSGGSRSTIATNAHAKVTSR